MAHQHRWCRACGIKVSHLEAVCPFCSSDVLEQEQPWWSVVLYGAN